MTAPNVRTLMKTDLNSTTGIVKPVFQVLSESCGCTRTCLLCTRFAYAAMKQNGSTYCMSENNQQIKYAA